MKALSDNIAKDNEPTELFYRGMSDSLYTLEPSVFRNENLLKNEHNLITDFSQNYPLQFEKRISAIDQLIYMQHHELPTRLIDITANPLVALFLLVLGMRKETKKKIKTKMDQ